MAPSGPLFGVLAAQALTCAREAEAAGGKRRAPAPPRVALLAVVLLLLIAVGLATASGAIARWSRPFDVSAPGETSDVPQVVVDAAGHVTVVWTGSDGGSQVVRSRGRLAARLELGQRVTLELRLRARPAEGACPYGETSAHTLRTKLIWIRRSAAP